MKRFRVVWLCVLWCWTATVMADLRVMDDVGQEVHLAAPAQRIVSLAPHITELLYAAGAGDALVGAVEYSDYPPEALSLPRVGGHDRFDLERILALRPDLVVAWKSSTGGSAVERIRELGIPVFLSEPRRLEDIPEDLLLLGRLAGTEAEARGAAERFRSRLRTLRERYAGAAPVRVFYQIWHQPLMTVNGEHLISDVIRLCGGVNVFADLAVLAPQVSVESVLAADPEMIIAGGVAVEQPEWRALWRAWPSLAATRDDHLHFIHPDLIQRHTPRVLDGAERMCELLDRARGAQGRIRRE